MWIDLWSVDSCVGRFIFMVPLVIGFVVFLAQSRAVELELSIDKFSTKFQRYFVLTSDKIAFGPWIKRQFLSEKKALKGFGKFCFTDLKKL